MQGNHRTNAPACEPPARTTIRQLRNLVPSATLSDRLPDQAQTALVALRDALDLEHQPAHVSHLQRRPGFIDQARRGRRNGGAA